MVGGLSDDVVPDKSFPTIFVTPGLFRGDGRAGATE